MGGRRASECQPVVAEDSGGNADGLKRRNHVDAGRATRRPGDPATRRPGDPATRRPNYSTFHGGCLNGLYQPETPLPSWSPILACSGALGLAYLPHDSARRPRGGFMVAPATPQQALAGQWGVLGLVVLRHDSVLRLKVGCHARFQSPTAAQRGGGRVGSYWPSRAAWRRGGRKVAQYAQHLKPMAALWEGSLWKRSAKALFVPSVPQPQAFCWGLQT